MAALKRQRGLTLIEVLVAVTLLALLSAGILTAMRTGMNALAKTTERLMANRRVLGAQRILSEQLANFVPATAECGAENGGPQSAFFEGKPQVMRFVTTYSIQEASRGAPRIVEMFVIPGAENRGVRLVVNELPYTGPRATGALCVSPNQYLPVGPRQGTFVLADQLAFCQFSFQIRLPEPETAGPWTQVWDKPEYPRAIRVELAPIGDDTARLRPAGVTSLLRVHRIPVFEYTDE